MVVTDQIAALRALGTDPIRKLVVPRVIAGTVMVPVLTVDQRRRRHARRRGSFRRTQLQVASSVYWNNVVAGSVHRRHLDGPDQAVRARLRARDDRLPRRAADDAAARRASAARRRNAVVAGSVAVLARRFSAHQAADRADVLRWDPRCHAVVSCERRAGEPATSPGGRLRRRVAGVRRQGDPRRASASRCCRAG